MSALPYQPVPTIAQRKALHADHAKRYREVQMSGAKEMQAAALRGMKDWPELYEREKSRQYRDNQDEAIAEMQAARIRYELARAERAEQEVRSAAGVACCAIPTPGEDGEPQVMAWVGSVPSILIIAAACVAWVAYYWGTP